MDIPAETLDELKCSSCELYLSRGPVYLQHDGATVCGRCYTPKRPACRNKQYEATARLLKFPCKYRELGCPETVPYVGQEEEIAHETACQHRQYICPVLGSARCNWLGPRATVLAHCHSQHPDRVLENISSLTYDIVRSSCNNYIITAFQLLFLLHTKVCVVSGKIFHAVRLLGAAPEAGNYFFNLDIKRNNDQLTREGKVAPEGCLAIQEPTSQAVNINSLLNVLGGFDGITFTVTVKRRVSDAADQLVRAAEKCTECTAEVTVFRYRDEGGWRCVCCAPARRACKNQPKVCTHTDINDKCNKHELLFCQQRTKCVICGTIVSRGSMSAHYDSVHQRNTHVASSTWRATRTGGRYCFVPGIAGTAVYLYSLSNTQFSLQVYIPVSSEQLRKFRCEVRVTDPGTGHARIFTPPTLYDQQYDWDIEVKKVEFPFWNTRMLDVCVDIRKAD